MLKLNDLPAWTETMTDTTGAPGGLVAGAVVDGRTGRRGRTFGVTLGFQACVEKFEMQRFQLLAARLGARLVVVDTPGFGYTASRLLPAERRALRAGDFSVLAARLWRVINEISGDARPSALLGYSMGSSTAAALATVANSSDVGSVDTVVLIEPVAGRRWRLPWLASAMMRDDRHIEQYLDETAEIAESVAPFDRRDEPGPAGSRVDLWTLALALCRAGLSQDLATAAEHGLRQVVLVHGDSSRLSTRAAAEELTARLDIPAAVLTTPGHHGLWHSLPRTADVAAWVASTLVER